MYDIKEFDVCCSNFARNVG